MLQLIVGVDSTVTMRNIFLTLLLVVGAVVATAACRQSDSPDTESVAAITLETDPLSPEVGRAVMLVSVALPDGTPVEGAVVALRGDMSHAGMQPVLVDAAEVGGGVYRADFEWTMAGDWIVTVTARLPDGNEARQEFSFAVAAP